MVLVQPGTARVLVTEMSGSGQLNPTPAAFEDSDMLVELYLSPTKLVRSQLVNLFLSYSTYTRIFLQLMCVFLCDLGHPTWVLWCTVTACTDCYCKRVLEAADASLFYSTAIITFHDLDYWVDIWRDIYKPVSGARGWWMASSTQPLAWHKREKITHP